MGLLCNYQHTVQHCFYRPKCLVENYCLGKTFSTRHFDHLSTATKYTVYCKVASIDGMFKVCKKLTFPTFTQNPLWGKIIIY